MPDRLGLAVRGGLGLLARGGRRGFLFVAGTTGCDDATMTMPEDAAAQAEAYWPTIASVLVEAGSGPRRIVRATYLVTDHKLMPKAVLAACGQVLAEVWPAPALHVVAGLLGAEMTVEIAVTATVG